MMNVTPAPSGEDSLRDSGVPFAVVRPTALTEEPGGMPLELDQGDTVKVGVGGREAGGRLWGTATVKVEGRRGGGRGERAETRECMGACVYAYGLTGA